MQGKEVELADKLQLLSEKPLGPEDEDLIDMQPYVDVLNSALNDPSNELIWLKGEFASGKSTVTNLLEKNSKNFEFYHIDLWSTQTSNDENLKNLDDDTLRLEKNFLYQLASKTDAINPDYVIKKINKKFGQFDITFKKGWWRWLASFFVFVFLLTCIFCPPIGLTIFGNEIFRWFSPKFCVNS